MILECDKRGVSKEAETPGDWAEKADYQLNELST